MPRVPGSALLTAEEIGESRLWPVAAVLTAASLYATMPGSYIAGSATLVTVGRIVVPTLAVALIWPLALTAPRRSIRVSVPRRSAALALIAVISVANAVSIVLLVHLLVIGAHIDGRTLLRAAIHIWCASVLVFALWFWQLDGGGPLERRSIEGCAGDFLFPQQAEPERLGSGWRPAFIDYLYVSFTNAAAFSPTDTMPLSRWAKMLMLVQSAISLMLAVMVVARAVNILN